MRLKEVWPGGGDPHFEDPFASASKLRLLSGGGGLVSTARDYLKIGQALLDGGMCPISSSGSGGGGEGGDGERKRILSPQTIALMARNHLPGGKDLAEMGCPLLFGLNRRGQSFGLGFGVVDDAAAFGCLASEGELSWNGAVNTVFWADPKQGIVVVFVTQLLTTDKGFRRKLRTLVNQAVVGDGRDGEGGSSLSSWSSSSSSSSSWSSWSSSSAPSPSSVALAAAAAAVCVVAAAAAVAAAVARRRRET